MNKNCVIYNDLEQGSDEWFSLRKGVSSSSERGLFASKKGFETYLIQKEAELHLQIMAPTYASAAMENGTELEPIARQLFAEEYLIDVKEVGFILRPDLNAGWSPDGIFKLPNGKYSGIEIKCRGTAGHYRVIKEGLDMPTYQQMQFAMAITDIEFMYFVGFNPDFEEDMQLHVIKVPRSEDMSIQILMLLAKVKSEIGL